MEMAEAAVMTEASTQALAAAHAVLASGSPATALALLAAIPAPQRQELRARQLQALCHIKLAGKPFASQAWHKVLGLAGGCSSASAANIRRQFKRLAALVHPDKCAWGGAGEAFASLRAAADSLLEAATRGEETRAGSRSPRNKRRRTSDDGGGAAWDDSDDRGEGWVPDGGGFPWWEEWDSPASRPEPAAVGAAQAGPEKCAAAGMAGASGRQQPGPSSTAAGTAAGQQQAQRSSEAMDQEQLAGMSLDELRGEVRQRQAALLSPPLDGTGGRTPLPQLQAALRRARTLLAERVATEAAAAAAASGGGFL